VIKRLISERTCHHNEPTVEGAGILSAQHGCRRALSVRLPRHATAVAYVALFVALGGTTYAATGGTFVLGHANSAGHTTSLKNTGSGPALTLTSQNTSTAPFAVSNSTKIAKLNADKLDGKDSTAFEPHVNRILGSYTSSTTNNVGHAGPWSFSLNCQVGYAQIDITGPGTVGGTYTVATGNGAGSTYVRSPSAIGAGAIQTTSTGQEISDTYFLTSGTTIYQVNLLTTATNGGIFEDCNVIGDAIRVK
jgi:hypothetical protein